MISNKVLKYIESIKNGLDVTLLCPKCKEPLFIKEASFVCRNHHCYDLSAKSYSNLSLVKKQSDYGKELFTNRRMLCEYKFFSPLEKEIATIVRKGSTILDAGCGEGSHLSRIKKLLENDCCGVGIDISADGISIAAKDKNVYWFVADIGVLPFASNSFDYILSILSPAHYGEAKRVLQNNGTMIKVIPEKGYLQELRSFFYEGTEKTSYSNDDTKNLFLATFPDSREINICYHITVPQEDRESFLSNVAKMTPLTWNSDKKTLDSFIKSDIKGITVDLAILVANNAG